MIFGRLLLGTDPRKETIEYTTAQASAVANLPLPAVHKLIEHRLIRPRRLRTGRRSIQRMLSREQVLYLRLEAEGVRLLPIAARRAIAKKIDSTAGIDAVILTEGSALVIQVKSVRLELDQELKKLERAANIVISDPEIMLGTAMGGGRGGWPPAAAPWLGCPNSSAGTARS